MKLPRLKSTDDFIEFSGELLALSMYLKKYPLKGDILCEPSAKGLTPDFRVGETYVEIYSPRKDSFTKEIEKYGGFEFRLVGEHHPSKLTWVKDEIERKSRKYKDISPLRIIIQIVSNTIEADFTKACKRAKLLNSRHSIIFLFGDKLTFIEPHEIPEGSLPKK